MHECVYNQLFIFFSSLHRGQSDSSCSQQSQPAQRRFKSHQLAQIDVMLFNHKLPNVLFIACRFFVNKVGLNSRKKLLQAKTTSSIISDYCNFVWAKSAVSILKKNPNRYKIQNKAQTIINNETSFLFHMSQHTTSQQHVKLKGERQKVRLKSAVLNTIFYNMYKGHGKSAPRSLS